MNFKYGNITHIQSRQKICPPTNQNDILKIVITKYNILE